MSEDFDEGTCAGRSKPDRVREPNPVGVELPSAETIDAPRPVAPLSHAATATHVHSPAPADGDAADDQPVITLGDYDVLGEIARGGMGVVYKAKHRADQQWRSKSRTTSAADCQIAQKRFDFASAHLLWMLDVVKKDVALDPIDVRPLGADRKMLQSALGPHPIGQLRL